MSTKGFIEDILLILGLTLVASINWLGFRLVVGFVLSGCFILLAQIRDRIPKQTSTLQGEEES